MAKLAKPEQHVLSNGIPVVLQNYDGPVAATYWWVRTGSADESPKEAGFAHFLEHMLFKDAAAKETGRASTGQMARAIESLGGDINAYTSFDQTVYHVTCAAHHWENVLDSFGTIAKPQKFLRADFEREREVILEELRKNNDSPDRQLFQSLFSATFPKHPYGRPVIGYEKILKAAKVGQLENFYRKNYVPANMGLVLVGPMGDGSRHKQIFKLLEKHFGSKVLKARPYKPALRKPDPVRRPEVSLSKRSFDVKTPTLAFSFRVPDLMHPDVPALDILSGILAMGEMSRLYQKLFYQTSIVTEVSGGMYIPRDPGMLYFQAEVDHVDKIDAAAEHMFKEMIRLRDEGPTQEELERVLVNSESERLYATQTADGMAGRLGFLKYVLGDLDFDRDYLEELREVDARRVQSVAAEYLDFRRMSITVLLPKESKDKEKFDLGSLGSQAKSLLTGPTEVPVKSKVLKKGTRVRTENLPEVITLPTGARVVYRENPGSHVMSIHSAVLGGLRLELGSPIESKETDWGASYMMSLTWTKGTRSHNSRSIAQIVEGHAGSMDGFAGRNTIGLQATGLARDWSELSELFNEVLLEPVFPDDEVAHSRRVAEDSIRGIDDRSSQLCSKLFLETLFEKHPYGYLTTGSLESIAKINSSKLQAFHRAWVRPERLVVAVSGAVKRPDLDRWLEKLNTQLARAASHTGRTLTEKLDDEPELKAPRWVEKSLDREQQHILVGGLGLRIDSEDRFAMRLLQTLLGGQSGRLFIELREKKSLAYTVSPISVEGVERGYVGTYIACAPQKRDEAIAGMKVVLEGLAKKGPTTAEMRRAKEFYLGRRAMELQSDSSIAAHYGLEAVYHLPRWTDSELIRKVEGISAREIQQVCLKYLVEPHMVTSVVG
jgi:zinc protease